MKEFRLIWIHNAGDSNALSDIRRLDNVEYRLDWLSKPTKKYPLGIQVTVGKPILESDYPNKEFETIESLQEEMLKKIKKLGLNPEECRFLPKPLGFKECEYLSLEKKVLDK